MMLYVARHGETRYNTERRYMGGSDIPLDENGKKQAKGLAEKLGGIEFDAVFSSPLSRALSTAEIVAAGHGLTPLIVPELAERNMGVYEGRTEDEIKALYPELWARRAELCDDDAPYGGETIKEFDARVQRGMEKIKAYGFAGNVLVVCHGLVSRSIHRSITHLPFDEMIKFLLPNCGYITYDI